ncbi:F-type H+-transporting ATPase subunit delta [Rhodobacteraceae bacterium MBR-64]|jgi:F-type H+-transporting ATPase subunit delta
MVTVYPDSIGEIERANVAESASISTGIAARYATAAFELAREAGSLDVLENDTNTLSAALHDSADLAALISSPLYSREQQGAAIEAVASAAGISTMLTNTLSLMARNRRLFVLPHLLAELRARIAVEKGEVTADVRSAVALTKAQSDKLAKALAASVGKEIKLNATVDENLIGGLVVKVGSKMIDTSIRSKLNALQNVMKEVG